MTEYFERDEISEKLDEIIALLKLIHATSIQLPLQPTEDRSSRCSKCGLDLSGIMGYSCSRLDCPAFPQITCVNRTGGV